MQLQQPFDARQVEPSSGYPPPPPYGKYHVRITDSDAKATSDKTGGYVEFMLEILDQGPYLNRKISHKLNLFNTNPTAVEIAYRSLSALCYVTGVFNVQDTRQLHGIPFIATIGPQKNDPQYAQVYNVEDINGNAPGKAGQGASQPLAPAAPPVAPPAWGAQPPQQPPAPAWPGAPQQPPQPAPGAPGAPPQWGAPQAPSAPAAPAGPPAWPGAPAAAAPAPAWQPPTAPQAAAPAAPAPPAPPWAPAAPVPAPPWATK